MATTAEEMKAKIDKMSEAQCAALLTKMGKDPAGMSPDEMKTALKAMADNQNDYDKMAGMMNMEAPNENTDLAAVTKSEADGPHPASDYLVVEDAQKPTTWHLQVKANGKPDHRLMGAAWAALHDGYRGNKYAGPQAEAALSKLTALYKSENIPLPGVSNQEIADWIFTELTADALNPVDGKWIDGMAAGTFTSMSGEEVTFSEADLSAYIDNTQKVIDSTKTESGQVVGLPIDMDGHDHHGGAGWIVGLELDKARKVIRFLVNWTQEGLSLIKNNVRRFFSPSVVASEKTIIGGSMTNYPATRGDGFTHLLRPVEFSQQLKELDMTDLVTQVAQLQAKVATLTGVTPAAPPADIGDELKEFLSNPADTKELAAKVEALVQQRVKDSERKGKVAQFAADFCSGSKDDPHGIAVNPQGVVTLLLSLPEKQADAVQKLLMQVKTQVVSFQEQGVGSFNFTPRNQLPAFTKKFLNDWIAAGKPMEQFFAVNPELGEMSQYNLAEFTKEK